MSGPSASRSGCHGLQVQTLKKFKQRSGLSLERGDMGQRRQRTGQPTSSFACHACQVTESLKPKEDMIAQLHLPHWLVGVQEWQDEHGLQRT